MELSFWKNKKVMITGHTGFKGSWLSLWLQHLGAQVIGYSLSDRPSEPNLFDVACVSDGMVSIYGDIGDYSNLYKVMADHEPEIIIHMAAQSLVRRSYANPVETYKTNVLGTVNIFEAARNTESVRVVINVTSDKCYENKDSDCLYKEGDPLGGHDPYSSSKACAELVSSAYISSFFNPKAYSSGDVLLGSVRAGNVIGGGDWAPDRLMPDCIRAFSSGQEVVLRYPDAIRPWQHVLEPLSGYLLLASKLYEGEHSLSGPWNFGPQKEDMKSVQSVVESVSGLWGEGARCSVQAQEQLHEASLLQLDSSKARLNLGWKPHWNIDKAVEETVAWYKEYLNRTDMKEYTIKQIQSYVGKEQS